MPYTTNVLGRLERGCHGLENDLQTCVRCMGQLKNRPSRNTNCNYHDASGPLTNRYRTARTCHEFFESNSLHAPSWSALRQVESRPSVPRSLRNRLGVARCWSHPRSATMCRRRLETAKGRVAGQCRSPSDYSKGRLFFCQQSVIGWHL